MKSFVSTAALAGCLLVQASLANAESDHCVLKLERVEGGCKRVVGYSGGVRVGPFWTTGKNVGNCAGDLPVGKVSGNKLTVEGLVYALADDCKSSTMSAK